MNLKTNSITPRFNIVKFFKLTLLFGSINIKGKSGKMKL